MSRLLGCKPLMEGIRSNLKPREYDKINTTNNIEEILKTDKFNQLAHDFQSQEQFLQDQETEMGVSKNAMSKYPTMGGIPTVLISILTFAAIAYGAKKGVEYFILDPMDSSLRKEEVVNDTKQNLQNIFVVDSTAIIDHYKGILPADEGDEFEQFSKKEQREHAQDNNK